MSGDVDVFEAPAAPVEESKPVTFKVQAEFLNGDVSYYYCQSFECGPNTAIMKEVKWGDDDEPNVTIVLPLVNISQLILHNPQE